MTPRSSSAALLGWCVLTLIAVQAGQTWLVERYQVASGSMAPALLGVHCHTQCAECNREYDIGLDRPPSDNQRTICPECGARGVKIDDLPVIGGDRVWLDRSVFLWRSPQRWEVVAFRSPECSAQVHVKRVVGLPGEEVQIRDGDVYINGAIPERSLEQIRAMSILVHDAIKAPMKDTGHGPRWKPKDDESVWKRTETGSWSSSAFQYTFGPDLLVFENRTRKPGDPFESQPAPIVDRCGYNQTQSIRDWNVIRDVRLHCQVPRHYGFLLDLHQSHRPETVHFCALSANPITSCDSRLLRWGIKFRPLTPFEYEIFDIDGRQEFFENHNPLTFSVTSETKSDKQESPFALSASECELSEFQVFRDIYYTIPRGLESQPGLGSPRKLGPDEYFVLGDNSQIAVDSRFPQVGAVDGKFLVGRVLGAK